jgi:hypothetical protein
MGLRFSRRIKILPGVTVNFSRKGISTSLGVRGARVTLGHGKQRVTVGVPGTGLSHTTVSNLKAAPATTPQPHATPRSSDVWTLIFAIGFLAFVAALAIFA